MIRQTGAHYEAPHAPVDVRTWRWPVAPKVLRVYDKYVREEALLHVGELVWVIPVRGNKQSFTFSADPATRQLQQNLVVLTQAGSSPSSIVQFTGCLLSQWTTYEQLVAAGPDRIKKAWSSSISEWVPARVGKLVLKLACSASVGPWKPQKSLLIEGLPSFSRATSAKHISRIRKRGKLLPTDVLAAITRVLDQACGSDGFSDDECEGLAALSMVFQHGVRPVQILSLATAHVDWPAEAGEGKACVVSFHAAKQGHGKEFEIPRRIKPEWTAPMAKLHASACDAGRERLFTCRTADALWTRVKQVCRTWSLDFDGTAGELRHSSAQSLADAGHSRESIRRFLGHSSLGAAVNYIIASRRQADRLNQALGASKLYGNVLSLATAEFVSVEDMLAAREEAQIGGVVGDRLIAGMGLCKSGQPACPYNPVTSCYGCSRFMPALDREIHVQVIEGIRAEVKGWLALDPEQKSPSTMQMVRALAGAQQTLALIDDERAA